MYRTEEKKDCLDLGPCTVNILSNQKDKSCKIKKAKKFLQSLPNYGHATTLFKLNLSAVPYFKNLTVLVHNSCLILDLVKFLKPLVHFD